MLELLSYLVSIPLQLSWIFSAYFYNAHLLVLLLIYYIKNKENTWAFVTFMLFICISIFSLFIGPHSMVFCLPFFSPSCLFLRLSLLHSFSPSLPFFIQLAYSSIWTQELLLVVLGEPYGMLRIKPRLATCKKSALPAVL